MPDRSERSGFVLTMNRDELRTRDEGKPYTGIREQTAAVYPVDALAGGTWIGLNDQGVCMALLNRYQSPSIADARSRGKIITETIHKGGMQACLNYLKTLPLVQFNPFDLLIVNLEQVWHLSWDRQRPVWRQLRVNQPIMLTSSSERLPEVSAYRQHLFSDWLKQEEDLDQIEAFHRYQALGREADAVYMSRQAVHSKSLVQIRANDQQAKLVYCDERALSSGVPLAQAQTFSLKLQEEYLECSA